jgi:hypothetical protein
MAARQSGNTFLGQMSKGFAFCKPLNAKAIAPKKIETATWTKAQ